MGGLIGGKQGEGQRTANPDNDIIRTCLQNATSLATYMRNLSKYFPKQIHLFVFLEGKQAAGWGGTGKAGLVKAVQVKHLHTHSLHGCPLLELRTRS